MGVNWDRGRVGEWFDEGKGIFLEDLSMGRECQAQEHGLYSGLTQQLAPAFHQQHDGIRFASGAICELCALEEYKAESGSLERRDLQQSLGGSNQLGLAAGVLLTDHGSCAFPADRTVMNG